MTLGTALVFASDKLANISDAPRLDAQRLLLHVVGQPEASWLFARPEQELTAPQERDFTAFVDRRATGEPLAYILGRWDFYGRSFKVTPDVLIPRPATEDLVEAALEYLLKLSTQRNQSITIAEIGTGSGCIAITLALELSPHNSSTSYQLPRRRRGSPKAAVTSYKIFATDISPAALAIAKENAKSHHVSDHILFLEGDMLEPLVNKKVDLIVSNPPYVPASELCPIPRGGRGESQTIGLRFEPHLALDGGTEGTNFTNYLMAAGLPCILETTSGRIEQYNFSK